MERSWTGYGLERLELLQRLERYKNLNASTGSYGTRSGDHVRKIKVAQVIYDLRLAGAERIVVELSVRPDRERYDPLVITLRGEGPLKEELRSSGVPVYLLGKRGKCDFTMFWKLVRLLRRQKPDVVHTHLFGPDIWGRTAAAIAGIPCIVSTLHAVDSWLNPFQLFLERSTALFTRRLIAVSEPVRRFYVERVGIAAEKVVLVRNGIDISRFPARVDPAEKRRALGLPEKTMVVGTAGRLEAQKDLFTWLRAARLLLAGRGDLEFIIAGEGSQRARIEDYSKNLGIADRVHFLGARRDVDEIYAICDVIMFSSLFEGLSLTMLEAMASEKAVVATCLAENREVIEDGRNGLLVQVGDDNGLASAVSGLLEHEDERVRLGRAARQTVETRFCIEGLINGVLEVYEKGLARGKASF
jgi:glycosyltransferase involved in cell wall biosynthesis